MCLGSGTRKASQTTEKSEKERRALASYFELIRKEGETPLSGSCERKNGSIWFRRSRFSKRNRTKDSQPTVHHARKEGGWGCQRPRSLLLLRVCKATEPIIKDGSFFLLLLLLCRSFILPLEICPLFFKITPVHASPLKQV